MISNETYCPQASKQNVEINTDKDLEHDIEIILCEENRQSSINDQEDSHD